MDKTRALAGLAAAGAALLLWATPVAALEGTGNSGGRGGGGGGLPEDFEIESGGEVRGGREERPSGGNTGGPATGEAPEAPVEEEIVLPAQVEAPAPADTGGGLPVTGGDIVGLTAIGATAIAVGTVLTRKGRRPVSAA